MERASSAEWSGSETVAAKGSPKTVDASSNDTPCFLRFASAFPGSHSKRTPPCYREGFWPAHLSTVGARQELRPGAVCGGALRPAGPPAVRGRLGRCLRRHGPRPPRRQGCLQDRRRPRPGGAGRSGGGASPYAAPPAPGPRPPRSSVDGKGPGPTLLSRPRGVEGQHRLHHQAREPAQERPVLGQPPSPGERRNSRPGHRHYLKNPMIHGGPPGRRAGAGIGARRQLAVAWRFSAGRRPSCRRRVRAR